MDSAVSNRTLSRRPARPLAISNLLFAVAALVFAMVVVGGITRLASEQRSEQRLVARL